MIRTDQCPYIEDAVNLAAACAEKAGVKSRVVRLESAAEIREKSPSAYGTFGLVLNGKLDLVFLPAGKGFAPVAKGLMRTVSLFHISRSHPASLPSPLLNFISP